MGKFKKKKRGGGGKTALVATVTHTHSTRGANLFLVLFSFATKTGSRMKSTFNDKFNGLYINVTKYS